MEFVHEPNHFLLLPNLWIIVFYFESDHISQVSNKVKFAHVFYGQNNNSKK